MKSIKKITGLTQVEMASYLGINRSQWSMYVSGKRTLPLEATKKLSELLKYLQKNEAKVNLTELYFKNQKMIQDDVVKKINNLEIILHLINIKINALKNNIEMLNSTINTLEYLKSETKRDELIIIVLEKRIIKMKTIYSFKNLNDLQMKKKNIELELENMRNLKKNSQNIDIDLQK
ncbi:helix-turn-helix domain-containing protein [Flavobacterium sp.]|uniref:helix-turn-helix domain-containing protein n=1 Tax=Flavobacterium sp. TaxID=239 RepID=UPI0039E5216D